MNTAQTTLKRTSVIRWTSIAVLLVSIIGLLVAVEAIRTGGGTFAIIGFVVAVVALLSSMGGLLYANIKFANLFNSVR